MGGAVRVIVREKSGKVHKMTRWTNNLNYWLQRPDLHLDPDKLLKEYINAGDDSEYNEETSYLSPYDYGLIVIDRVNNIILSHQGYTDLARKNAVSIKIDLSLSSFFNAKADNEPVPFIKMNEKDKYIRLASDEEERESQKLIYDNFMTNRYSIGSTFIKRAEKYLKENPSKKLTKELSEIKLFNKKIKKKKPTKEDWKNFLQFCLKNSSAQFEYNLKPFKLIDYDLEHFGNSKKAYIK